MKERIIINQGGRCEKQCHQRPTGCPPEGPAQSRHCRPGSSNDGLLSLITLMSSFFLNKIINTNNDFNIEC